MEEAYLRLEESNRRIQEQYGTLLRQYADLSRSLSNSGVTNRGAGQRNLDVATKPAASGESSVPDYPNLAEVLGLDEQDGGNARSVSLPRQPGSGGVTGAFDDAGPGDPSFPAPLPPDPAQGPPSGVGAQGGIGRGTTGGAGTVGPAFGPDSAQPGGAGMSRMDRIGVGAEGTGGRVSPYQQPTRAFAVDAKDWVYRPDAAPRPIGPPSGSARDSNSALMTMNSSSSSTTRPKSIIADFPPRTRASFSLSSSFRVSAGISQVISPRTWASTRLSTADMAHSTSSTRICRSGSTTGFGFESAE